MRIVRKVRAALSYGTPAKQDVQEYNERELQRGYGSGSDGLQGVRMLFILMSFPHPSGPGLQARKEAREAEEINAYCEIKSSSS